MSKQLVIAIAVGCLFYAGCTSYSGCVTLEDRIVRRYERNIILKEDGAGTTLWKGVKHIGFDVITFCFGELWYGRIRYTYQNRELYRDPSGGSTSSSFQIASTNDVNDSLTTNVVARKNIPVSTTGSRPVGAAAKGYAESVARSIDVANEEVRQKYYKDNPRGYEDYLGYARFSQSKTLENAYRYEAEQLRIAAKESRQKSITQSAENISRISCSLANSGPWETNTVSTLTGIKTNLENEVMKCAFYCSPLLSTTNSNLSLAQARQMRNVERKWEERLEMLYQYNENTFKQLHSKVVSHAVNNGSYPHVAESKANAFVRDAALKVMRELIAAKNLEAFEYFHHKLKERKIIEFQSDGVTVKSDEPMRRWCLTMSDIQTLADEFELRMGRTASRDD